MKKFLSALLSTLLLVISATLMGQAESEGLIMEDSDIACIKSVGNTVYLVSDSDIEANNIKNEKYRPGYDQIFDFTDSVEQWSGYSVNISHIPGYMRFDAYLKNDGTYDPRAFYDFTQNASTITGGQYLNAADYDSIIIGFIADEVAADSTPCLYISTEAQPSYTNPVRVKRATSPITADMADGNTLREVVFDLSDWAAWTGNIKQIYLDILDNVDGDLRVDYIRLKHRDLKLTVKTNVHDEGVTYTYTPGSHIDLTSLPINQDFFGYSLVFGTEDYITELDLTEDTVIYANYGNVWKAAVIWNFDDNTLQGWSAQNALSTTVKNGIVKLVFKTDNRDGHLQNDNINLPASKYRYLVVKARTNVLVGFSGNLPFMAYFRCNSQNWSEQYTSITKRYPASEDFKTYIIDMKANSNWNGNVYHLRVDPMDQVSPSETSPYYFEFDEILLAEEAFLMLNSGYDGGASTTYSVPACTEITLSDYKRPVRKGYKFGGWIDGETGEVVTSVYMDKDRELVAKWVPDIIEWSFDSGEKEGWSVNVGVDKGITDGVYKVAFSQTNTDTWLKNTNVNFEASNYKYLIVYMRHNIPESAFGSTPFEAFFVRSIDRPWQAHLTAKTAQKPASDNFVSYIVDMSKCAHWNGNIVNLRIDPFEIKSTADTEYYFEVDKILLSYDVTLTLDGNNYTVPAGVEVSLSDYAEPVRNGYVFAGWSYEADGDSVKTVNLSEDTVLYPLWEADTTAVTAGDERVKAVYSEKDAVLVVSGWDSDGRVKNTIIRNVFGMFNETYREMGLDLADVTTVKAFLLEDTKSMKPISASVKHVLDTNIRAAVPAAYDDNYGTLVYFNNFKDKAIGEADLAVLDAGAVSVIDGKYAAKSGNAGCPSKKSGEMVHGIEIISADGIGNPFKYKDGTPIEGKMTIVYTAYNADNSSCGMNNVADTMVLGFDVWLGFYLDWSGNSVLAANSWSTWNTKPFDVTRELTRVGTRAGALNRNIYFHSVAVYVKKPEYVILTDENGKNGENMPFTSDTYVFPAIFGERVIASWTDGHATYAAGDAAASKAVAGKSFAVKQYADLSVLKGLNIVCIGDSITEGDYGSVPAGRANVRAQNYPYFLGKFSGANVVNNGKCGYYPTIYYKNILPSVALSSDTDIVLIMLGTNFGLTDTLDTDTAAENYNNYASTETGTYAKIVEYIREKTGGNAKIILMTPPVTTRRQNVPYMATTCAVIRKIAAKYGLDIIENQLSCGITLDNIGNYMPNDGLHPGYEGYKLIGAYVAAKTAELYQAK